MDDSLRELYQDVILDHSRHPRHFGPLPAPTHTASFTANVVLPAPGSPVIKFGR